MKRKINLLQQYLEDRCIQQSGFAKKIGVSSPTLHNIINNKSVPSVDVAAAIEIETEGKVPMTSWISNEQIYSNIHKLRKNLE